MQLRLLFLLSAALLAVAPAVAQTGRETFGKNRIQHEQFAWKYVSSNNFNVYYYKGGEGLARQTAHLAEEEFRRISDLFGFAPYSRIKLFVYQSKVDLRQSNVGLDSENSEVGSGGQTFLTKAIIEIPFEGNQEAFRGEIALGIARTLVREMMYGGSLKDMLQSSYLLSLPEWFAEGAARYAAYGWSSEMDDYMRDLMLTSRLKKPSRLTGDVAAHAGQSLWNYIAETYGRGNISNILNLTRIIRNEETSIGSTLGISYGRVVDDWERYYEEQAEEVDESYRMPDDDQRVRRKNRRLYRYNDARLSPDGRYLAYSENDRGRFRVVIKDLQEDRRRVVHREGYRVIQQRIDVQVPLLAWRSTDALAIVSVRRGGYVVRTVDPSGGGKELRAVDVNQISDFDVAADGRTVVLSADEGGQNDLYLFDLERGGLRQLTKDIYDDLKPRFVGNTQEVVFASNRAALPGADTLTEVERLKSLKENPYLLHTVSRERPDPQPLGGRTIRGREPVPVDGGVLFVSDARGVDNLFRYDRSTDRVYQVTDFRQNVRTFDIKEGRGGTRVALQMLNEGREYLYHLSEFNAREETRTPITLRRRLTSVVDPEPEPEPEIEETTPDVAEAEVPVVAPPAADDGEIDIDNYVFESEKAGGVDEPAALPIEPPAARPTFVEGPAPEIKLRGPFDYTNRLSTDEVISTLYLDPLRDLRLGILVQNEMTDMFEDHKIRLGALLFTPDLLRSSRMWGEYEYLRHRVDYRVKLRRDVLRRQFNQSDAHRYALTRLDGQVAYPFNVASRIGGGPLLAVTRFSDQTGGGITRDDQTQEYAGGHLEYVFDNTISGGINILTGTRLKARYEHFYGVGASENSFGHLYVDARHYQPLHRNIVLAVRGYFGSFRGAAPKNYLLGGMQNWIGSASSITEVTNNEDDPLNVDRSDGVTPLYSPMDWLFNRFATNLRGFKYNAFYGNNVLLFNVELRVPLVQYLYQGPISSSFLRNLQFVAFTDVGSTWSGSSPFTRDNSFNTRTLSSTDQNGFRITVINYRNPFLVGYGAGVRTMLLGYFVKADLGWGIRDYVVEPPRFYLTIGHDF
ncbi:MAG: hypothetical protein WBA12_04415 [Catalinimonas sp.]